MDLPLVILRFYFFSYQIYHFFQNDFIINKQAILKDNMVTYAESKNNDLNMSLCPDIWQKSEKVKSKSLYSRIGLIISHLQNLIFACLKEK